MEMGWETMQWIQAGEMTELHIALAKLAKVFRIHQSAAWVKVTEEDAATADYHNCFIRLKNPIKPAKDILICDVSDRTTKNIVL